MKGNEKIIAILNRLLAEELTAINQYVVQSEMNSNWGYERLHMKIEKIAIDEMKHAEKLIARILFLEGTPTVSQINTISIGKDAPTIIGNDVQAETDAIKSYNDAVRQAIELGDGGTRELLEHNLADEERHLDWYEAQRDQIAQMGVGNYLVTQTEEK
jgi:bacterioferritin